MKFFEDVNLDKLQEKLDKGDDQNVRINQRELIKKILARYSDNYTILRELIQNSNDACSTEININLIREKNKIIFQNNGYLFTETDWDRIRTIASGNLNENSVGCFGVGFYSVFSITESPTIISGNKVMQFKFRNAMLNTRIIEQEKKEDTTIFIFRDVNDDIFKLWDINDTKFKNYLFNSLKFTTNLQKISISDTKNTLTFHSKLCDEKVSIPHNAIFQDTHIKTDSKNYIVSEKEISLVSTFNEGWTKRFVLITVEFDIRYGEKFIKNMKNVMTKTMPKKTQISMTLNDEANHAVVKWEDMFKDNSREMDIGNIYIGYKTYQTVGMFIDINAQFIPTVERENIDFSNTTVSIWNNFLIKNCGYILKNYYDYIMNNFKDDISKVNHICSCFSMTNSYPIVKIANDIQSLFLDKKILVPSTKGIQCIQDCYYPKKFMFYDDLLELIDYPIVNITGLHYNSNKSIIEYLVNHKLINHLSADDIVTSINKNVRDENILTIFNWLIYVFQQKILTNIEFANIYRVAKKIIYKDGPIGRFTHYIQEILSTQTILLPYIIPFNISKNYSEKELETIFKLRKFDLIDWAQYVLSRKFSKDDIQNLFEMISMNTNEKNSQPIIMLIKKYRCVPTNNPINPFDYPRKVYLHETGLLNNPQITTLNTHKIRTHFMKDIGILTEPSLDDVITNLKNANNTLELIEYLIKNKDKLDETLMGKLSKTKFIYALHYSALSVSPVK